MDQFNEIIFREFGYDVSVAEQIMAKHQAKLDTYNETVENEFQLPEIHFPGLGFIRIEFIQEDDIDG